MNEYMPYGDTWRAQIMRHTKQEIVMILGTALAEKDKKIAVLKAEVDALLKKLERSNDAWIRGQKEIAKLKAEAQELHDKYGLLWDQIAGLKAEVDRCQIALKAIVIGYGVVSVLDIAQEAMKNEEVKNET